VARLLWCIRSPDSSWQQVFLWLVCPGRTHRGLP
jgi:hypothetical protein